MTKCWNCGSIEIDFVEYAWDHPEHYDGISEFVCRSCGQRKGRWTGKILEVDETENRYGRADDA